MSEPVGRPFRPAHELGRLYLGNLRLDADPYSGLTGDNFSTNRVDLRAEQKLLFHVRDAKGARRVVAA